MEEAHFLFINSMTLYNLTRALFKKSAFKSFNLNFTKFTNYFKPFLTKKFLKIIKVGSYE